MGFAERGELVTFDRLSWTGDYALKLALLCRRTVAGWVGVVGGMSRTSNHSDTGVLSIDPPGRRRRHKARTEDGEILVTQATSPPPAFAVIGACVCDGGGPLTRAAIVAREYGIPCVVGTSVATLRIKTGDLIEVDGPKGVVTILFRARSSSERGG